MSCPLKIHIIRPGSTVQIWGQGGVRMWRPYTTRRELKGIIDTRDEEHTWKIDGWAVRFHGTETNRL